MNMISTRILFIAWVVALTLSLAFQERVSADDYLWTGAIDDWFDTPGNWEVNGTPPANPPGASDTVIFDVAGSTSVDFQAHATVSGVESIPGTNLRTVTFNLDGFELTGDFNTTELGEQTLVFDGGTFVINNQLLLGSGDPNVESVIRLENGATMDLAFANGTSPRHALGDSGRFALEVSGGSELVSARAINIGQGADVESSLWISGADSVVHISLTNNHSNNHVGIDEGTGELLIEAGGRFNAGRRLMVGNGADGTLTVRGSGLDEENNEVFSTVTAVDSARAGLFLGGDHNGPASSGSAYALFQDGGQGLFRDGLAVYTNATLEVDQGFVELTHGGQSSDVAPRVFAEGSEIIYWLYTDDTGPRIDLFGGHNDVDFHIDNATLTLELDAGFSAEIDDEFFLIRHRNLTGSFADMGDGAKFSVGDYWFQIGYNMGTGGDMIGLAVIPEPSVSMLFLTGALGLLLARRRPTRSCREEKQQELATSVRY